MAIPAPPADTFDYSPETRMIELCRELFDGHPELRSIQFKTQREDGDFTNYSRFRPKDTPHGE